MNSTKRDLSLVLPNIRSSGSAQVNAYLDAGEADFSDAIQHAMRILCAASAPAIIGLEYLTVEAVHQAVLLAQAIRGRLLPHRPIDPVRLHQAVAWSSTLDQARQCDVWIRVGTEDKKFDHVEQHISDGIIQVHAKRSLVKTEHPSLEVVLKHRAVATKDPGQWVRSVLKRHARSAVVTMAHGCDARVVSQWHKLAVDVQEHVRMAVMELPSPDAANCRGAEEVVAWMTGRSLAAGGVDFSDPQLHTYKAIDVAVSVEKAQADVPQRISIGAEVDSQAQVGFVTPGLAAGLAARVMRFDGAMFWLCTDTVTAAPDPTVKLLADLRQAIGTCQ